MDAIKALKVVELKQKLEALGLPTNGLKTDLIQRLLESTKDGELKSTRSKRVSNSSVQSIQDEVRSNTPTKRSRRLSNTSVLSIQEEAKPDTPSKRGRRLSSAVKEEANVETPTKKNALKEATAVDTPTKRSRRLSNVSASVPEESQVGAKLDTPVKRSRRLSNASAQEEIKAETPSKGSEEEVGTPIKRGRRPSNSSLLKERADTPIKIQRGSVEEQTCASIKKTRRSVGLNKIDEEEDSVKRGAGRLDQLKAEEISLTPRRRSRRLSNSSVTEEEAVAPGLGNKMGLDQIDEAAEENEERSVPIKKRRVIEPISDLFSDDCMDTLPEETDSLDTNAFVKTTTVELETKELLAGSSNSDETEEKMDATVVSNNTPLNTESIEAAGVAAVKKYVISPAVSVDLDSDVDVTSKQDSELDEHLLDTTEESSVDADDAIKSNATTVSNGDIDVVPHIKNNETTEGVKIVEEKLAENLLDTTEDSNCDIAPSDETVSVDEASLKKNTEELESTSENEVSTVEKAPLKENTELESSAKNEVGDISKKDTQNSNDATGDINCDMEPSEQTISVDGASMKKNSEELKSSAKKEGSLTNGVTAVKQVEALSLKDNKENNGISGAECKVSTMDTTEKPTKKSDFEKSELWIGQSMENYFSHTSIAKPKTNMLVKADIIPRQKPKSGKFWKAERKQFNHVKKDKGPRLTFEQRLQRKEEQTKSKEIAELIINRKKQKKQELREKIEANKKKKEENERKSEIYQVINNPNKIKRMKKKQLRMVAKRDTLEMKSTSNAAA